MDACSSSHGKGHSSPHTQFLGSCLLWPNGCLSQQLLSCCIVFKAPFTRFNLLSNRLSMRFDNRVNVCIHDTTGCQTRCHANRLSTRFDNRLYRVYKHSTDCQTRLTTGLTTGLTNGCIVYTAGCQTGCTTRFDNWLNEQCLFVQHGCQTRCQSGCQTGCTTSLTGRTTGLTTGCIV